MRLLLPLAVLVAAAPALAQDDLPPAPIPRLAAEAASPEGFVPRGWKLEVSKTGDLNGDKVPDVAMVLHGQDPKLVLRDYPGQASETFDTNPRILAVAFGKPGGGYRLALQNATLIPRRDNPSMDDPFEGGLEIARGVLRVKIYLFMSAGGWTTFNADYAFRWQNGRFELIGYDRGEVHRGSGETTDISINFSTGRMSVTKGSIESDTPGKPVWSTYRGKRPVTIEMIGNGLDWQPWNAR